MNRSRLWFVLAVVLIFMAGIAVGIFAERGLLAKRPTFRRPPSSSGGNVPTMSRWFKDLGLTAEQQAKIKEIFKANDERMRNDENIKELRAESNKRFAEIREQLKKEIDSVLTAEQKKKLEAMIQRNLEERRKDSERGNRRNDPRSNPIPKKESFDEKEEMDRRPGGPGGSRGGHPGLFPD
jgi:Spy/CpxP family protein refolding chaperone